MNVFNQNVPFEVYRTFDDLVRKSRLCGKAGTITLSTHWETLEISATLVSFERPAEPCVLGRAPTAERLFAQVFSSLAQTAAAR